VVGAFARYLHSLSAPIQIVVRTARLDLSEPIAELRRHAPELPHPALEDAALDHADFLARLAEHTQLLRRQILLVVREPLRSAPSGPARRARLFGPRSAAEIGADDAVRRAATARLVRRVAEATELLSAAGITVTSLDAGQATAVLASACDPDTALSPSAGLAGAHEVITTAPGLAWDDGIPQHDGRTDRS
jgi:hypothetical protein